MITEGRVGLLIAADGSEESLRLFRTAALIEAPGHARYTVPTYRAMVYSLAATGVTQAAANIFPPGAASTPLVGIFNPVGSGKSAAIIRAVVQSQTGTIATDASFMWCVIPSPAGITAAGTAPLNNATFTTTGSSMRGFSNSALTGGLAGSNLRKISWGALATTVTEETAGSIIVQPGSFVGIYAGSAAGTTWVVSAYMEWEEIPV